MPKNSKSDYSNRSDSFSVINAAKFSPAAKIKVIGVGGGGGNAIKRMIELGLEGVEFWAFNTDLQALKQIHSDGIIQLGANITRGLGAGMSPEVGRQSAEESIQEIEAALSGADMVFITAGMGGGTGTGASPVVAEIAKRLGILTIGVITKPFDFEGLKRRALAEEGMERLKANADAVIVVPNERLLQIVDKRTSVSDAFKKCDEVLREAIQGISDLINFPGEINVDFADVRAIMSNAGTALMGMGKSTGASEDRARQAALMAIDSPLLELSIEGARGVLFNVQGGKSLSLSEISEAAEIIQQQVDPDAKIIFGTSIDANLNDEIRITVIATGFNREKDEIISGFGNIPNANNTYSPAFSQPRFSNNLTPNTTTSPTSNTTSYPNTNPNTNQNNLQNNIKSTNTFQSTNSTNPNSTSQNTNQNNINQNTIKPNLNPSNLSTQKNYNNNYQSSSNQNNNQSSNQNNQSSSQNSNYKEEYDIPAFLRKRNSNLD